MALNVCSNKQIHLNPEDPADPYKLYGLGPVPPKRKGSCRIWVDGCFDMLHFGHINALRQAREFGDELFVGCHSDKEIVRYKGPPIMSEQDRYEALRGCMWVDYVVENYPYCTRLKDMELLEIDYVAHGDDISVDLNGNNSYQEIIDAGKFKVFKRTSGVSTTDLVDRMLFGTNSHLINGDLMLRLECVGYKSLRYLSASGEMKQVSHSKEQKATDVVVYVEGAFDMFHVGHLRLLEAARALGTYLMVGIYTDDAINKKKGENFPIMNINERALGVLGCRYVDEVVVGVPFGITEKLIDSLGIKKIAAGILMNPEEQNTLFSVPKRLNIFYLLDSHSDLTTEKLIKRVLENRNAFEKRQAEKKIKDANSIEVKPGK